jgi:small subunit ribosomal protein S8
MTDVVGDFIIRLKNAGAVGKTSVSAPFSQFRQAIAEKLKSAGYITAYEKRGKKVRKTLEVTLKYRAGGAHAISGVKRISHPGQRMYRGVHDIKSVKYGHGALILSTPKGVLTDKEAKREKVGGEALFEIW